MFDPFGASRSGAILETNRGCPFGCTFCDWGSATLSRVRKFNIDRVFEEIEWCARNQIQTASFADANFGMLERDVSIAEKIAEMKRTYGYPKTVATNYAKNNVKHLRKIIEIFASVEILTKGVVSLQSMDEVTLKVIDRSNIKLEKYNELTTEFRQAHLPLAADIMMGLPGSTPRSFFNDLQECTDRDVRVRANPTLLLTNSPMNDPQYREEHGIVAKPGDILMETASYTREEWHDMNELRMAFNLFDNWGVLRYVGRFVRSATGMGEVEFYDRLRRQALRHPDDWPVVVTTLKTLETTWRLRGRGDSSSMKSGAFW
ncbi:MAG: radical SAM protein [Halioglobus sp.]|nr:radical SAM protein [Halioglobus sp.]